MERLNLWIEVAGIRDDRNGALLRPVATPRGKGYDGFSLLTTRAVEKLVWKYAQRIGLDPAVTVHSIRVTALTTARERGAYIIDLQDFAGRTFAHESWKGFLKLSLVSVPVQAFTATAGGEGKIQFHQLHAACHSRIEYKKTCPIHGAVPNGEIVSGYEYAKGQYVIVDTAELEAPQDLPVALVDLLQQAARLRRVRFHVGHDRLRQVTARSRRNVTAWRKKFPATRKSR